MKKQLFLISLLAMIGLSLDAQTAYITNWNSNTVSVVNVATNTVTTAITVGSEPLGVSVSTNGSKVYVTDGSDSISVINTVTNTVTATIIIGHWLTGVSVTPDGSKLYVTDGSDSVSVINTATNTVIATILVGNEPAGVSVSPDGGRVYVANYASNTVSVINTTTDTVTATIPVYNAPEDLSVSTDGSKVYVVNDSSNTVSVINTAADTVAATITVGSEPQCVSISPDGSKVYVTNSSSGTVSVINTVTNTVTATITVGYWPMGVSVSPDGSMVYVVNNDIPGTVSVINTATNSVIATITVGNAPVAFGNFISRYTTLSISPSANPICTGTSATLIASGANTYSWSGGLGTSDTVVVSPTTTTTYTVTGTAAWGTSSANITINVNALPVANAGPPVQICPGAFATLDASGSSGGSGPLSFNWSSGGTSAQVIVSPYSTTLYTVTVTSNGCTSTDTVSVIVHPNPVVSVSASANPICAGASTTLTASGALVYNWSIGSGMTDSLTVMPTANTTYSVTGTDGNGCTASANISISLVWPAIPEICMVTTDSTTHYKYNVVCWDKTPYNNVDSFIVYRMDALTSSYLRIGAVSANALSEFIDTSYSIGGPNGGNPMYSSWLYKLAIRDTCGNIGDKSPYHQTMFVQQSGANFSWNAYTVEAGQTNPVTGYSFLRDDNNTGNWHVLINITTLSSTDPYYASYPNGNWRIDALGFDCAPTMRLSGTGSFIKSHSNTIKPVPMGIEQHSLNNEELMVYPNPANEEIQVIGNQLSVNSIEIYNLLGEKVYATTNNKPQTTNKIDISSFPSGVYVVEVRTEKGIAVKKFVKE